MYLRELQTKDAPLMLEWMHDSNVVEKLKGNFLTKKLDDAVSFISSSKDDLNNLHLAICSDEDEYMGTVSLKNIDYSNKYAEFAIAIRSCAMGKGYSAFGMQSIFNKAINDLQLSKVYWCVSNKNERAVRFYNKHLYNIDNDIPIDLLNRYSDMNDLLWYSYSGK